MVGNKQNILFYRWNDNNDDEDNEDSTTEYDNSDHQMRSAYKV
jgi:hypothetical protein